MGKKKNWRKQKRTPKSSRTKGSKFTQEEQTSENNQNQAEINSIESRRTMHRINKPEDNYLRKSTIYINHSQTNQRAQDSILIEKIRNEKGDITTESEEIKKNHQILLQNTIFNNTGKLG